MFLLLPDLNGGFSFYQMAERFPNSGLWTALAKLFTHVQWSGFSIWDLIMPSFAFLVGVAMSLSAAARRARGDTQAQIVTHILLRAAVLFLLAMILRISFRTLIDELWPLLLLSCGLPLPQRLATALGIPSQRARRNVELAWCAAVVTATAVWLRMNLEEIGNYSFNTIFSQLGLALPFAFLLVGRGARVQLTTALAILLGYWLLYALHPLPGAAFDPASVGVAATDEWYSGFFAHWNKNANAGFAFDVWFLNALPRAVAFEYDKYGLTTLNFLPTISTMLFGVFCGELLRSGRPALQIRRALLWTGAAGVATGATAALWLSPLVKSLWTPSWALFTGGVTIFVLAALYELCDLRKHRTWTMPFAILGMNAILLYTFAASYRWWFLALPTKLFGIDLATGPYGPMQASVGFLAMLWAVAFVLYRFRIFVRL
jgi:heparan-alpha-glucosaminide N-acetyltransferase